MTTMLTLLALSAPASAIEANLLNPNTMDPDYDVYVLADVRHLPPGLLNGMGIYRAVPAFTLRPDSFTTVARPTGFAYDIDPWSVAPEVAAADDLDAASSEGLTNIPLFEDVTGWSLLHGGTISLLAADHAAPYTPRVDLLPAIPVGMWDPSGWVSGFEPSPFLIHTPVGWDFVIEGYGLIVDGRTVEGIVGTGKFEVWGLQFTYTEPALLLHDDTTIP